MALGEFYLIQQRKKCELYNQVFEQQMFSIYQQTVYFTFRRRSTAR